MSKVWFITGAGRGMGLEIAKAALPIWQQLHPDVEVRIVSRQYADHHTAMTTALSTSVLLPDAMALESSLIPVPSELVMIPAGYRASLGELNPWLAVLAR